MKSKLIDYITKLASTWPFPEGDQEVSEPENWPFPTNTNEPITLTATKEGIKFVHFTKEDYPDHNECTVAYRPCHPQKGLKMLELAVTYKNPKDQYNRKIAAATAARRFFNGQTVCMPLRGKNNSDTYWNLFKTFVLPTTK